MICPSLARAFCFQQVIKDYTRESGVRSLDRKIAAIMRNIAKKKAIEEKYDAKLTKEHLTGPPDKAYAYFFPKQILIFDINGCFFFRTSHILSFFSTANVPNLIFL